MRKNLSGRIFAVDDRLDGDFGVRGEVIQAGIQPDRIRIDRLTDVTGQLYRVHRVSGIGEFLKDWVYRRNLGPRTWLLTCHDSIL